MVEEGRGKDQEAAVLPDLKAREAAVAEMAKALRAISMYPSSHPQRTNVVSQSYTALQTILQQIGDLTFKVSRSGFLFNNLKVADKHPLAADLAQEMHLRQIKSFSLRPELTPEDWANFLELLLEAPENFRRGRFIARWFKTRQIQTIWINEMDFSKIMTMAESAEEEAEERRPSLEAQVDELLDLLEKETDPECFGQLLRELELLALPFQQASNYTPLWAITATIADHALPGRHTGATGERIQALARRTVQSLIRGDFLLHLLERSNRQDEDQETLEQVLQLVGPSVVDGIITFLCRSESLTPFRSLLNLAIKWGPEARAVLESYLEDQNPLKVRRALLVLGERRSRESVEAVRKLLNHKDPKIRREAVRALSLIRGIEASRALLGALHTERELEIKIAIITALAESRDPAGVPSLSQLVQRTRLREDTVELVEATVEALGRIGSRDALPVLIKSLNRFSLFQRPLALRVRLKAATALGRLGGESAMQALARYARPGEHPLRQRCTAVLKALIENDGRPVEVSEEQEK